MIRIVFSLLLLVATFTASPAQFLNSIGNPGFLNGAGPNIPAQGWGAVNRSLGVGTLSVAGDTQFETWLGHSVSWSLGFANGPDWPSLQAFAITQAQQCTHLPVVMGIYIPANKTIADVNAGTEDAQFAQVADTFINACAATQSVLPIRLFPEFNNPASVAYAPGDETNWIKAYRRVLQIFLHKSLKVRAIWNSNYTTNYLGSPYNISLAYPGDDAVDVIAQDIYKISVFDGNGLAAWNIRLNEAYGTAYLTSFAATRSSIAGRLIPLAYPEWGIDNNADGPFVTAMGNYIIANPVAFHCYYNVNNGPFFQNKLSDDQYPAVSTVFKATF